MLRKLFVAGCLGAFALSLASCSSGDPTKIEMGEKEVVDDFKDKAVADPEGSGANKALQITD